MKEGESHSGLRGSSGVGVSLLFGLIFFGGVQGAILAEEAEEVAWDSDLPLDEFSSEEGDEPNRISQLQAMSLEELLNVDVTSVSRRATKFFESPAAVFVISGDDIRRSGAQSFPEALRMSPGISVAQINNSSWAVASRGFNDQFTDRLLVMVDGRSVYSPKTSGVFWNAQDYFLEDIERIEVIRGPGGALWGANAVNGVVNIITKDAEETDGFVAKGGFGTEGSVFGGLRFGHQMGENGYFRSYFQGSSIDARSGGHDAWDKFQTGFRGDWDFVDAHFTLQGDIYSQHHDSRIGIPSFLPSADPPFYGTPALVMDDATFKDRGGNLLARYTKEFGDESELQIQAYYDRFERDALGATSRLETYDLDAQYRFPVGENQEWIVGLGYRYLPDHLEADAIVAHDPSRRNEQLFSAFVQDEISFLDDQLRLTLGSKLEHNGYTGWEFQPSARVAWLPAERQVVWAAVSRAVQVPARNYNDIQAFLPPIEGSPLLFRSSGNKGVEAQDVLSYELGYRIQPTDDLSFDVALYYNDHDDIASGSPDPDLMFNPGPPFPFMELSGVVNGGGGYTYGLEFASVWRVSDNWQLTGTYTYQKIEFDEVESLYSAGKDPQHMVSIRSSVDLTEDVELDIWARYVDSLSDFGGIDSYFDLDIRIGWQATENLELSIVGQNLFEPERYEFGPNEFVIQEATEVPRGVYVQATYDY